MITFSEFKKKEVLDISSGKNLGKTIDIIFERKSGRIDKIVTSGKKSGFLSCENLEIPYANIVRIGDDAILVELHRRPKEEKCISICCESPCDEKVDGFSDD